MLISEISRLKCFKPLDYNELIYHRDFLHRKDVINKHIDTFNLYREIWNKVTATIRKAKSAYYTSFVHTANNNTRFNVEDSQTCFAI